MMAFRLKSNGVLLAKFVLVFLIVLCADQISKQIMLDLLFDPPRYLEVGLILNLVPVWNSGMSFGLLSDGGLWVRVGLTLLAFLDSGWFVWALPQLDRRQRFAGAIIAGGAIGNAIDRLRFGRVVDFIDFHIGAGIGQLLTLLILRLPLGPDFGPTAFCLDRRQTRHDQTINSNSHSRYDSIWDPACSDFRRSMGKKNRSLMNFKLWCARHYPCLLDFPITLRNNSKESNQPG